MIFDLFPDHEMSPTVGILHATVTDTYKRLVAMVSDMTQAELDSKGAHRNQNSTSQLLRHLAVVDLHWAYRLKGEQVPQHLQEQYGPMIDENGQLPAVSGIPVQQLIHEYDQVQLLFRDACKALTDADLDKQVEYEKGAFATIRWGIWHIADHSRYHQAHITWLKKWARGV